MTIIKLIDELALSINNLRDTYNNLALLNIYYDQEHIDLMLTEFIAQYDLLLTEQQKDYIRLL
jgi:hypothetical protein